MTDRLDETIFGADGRARPPRAAGHPGQSSRPAGEPATGGEAARWALRTARPGPARHRGARRRCRAGGLHGPAGPGWMGCAPPSDYPGPGSGSVSFVINPGTPEEASASGSRRPISSSPRGLRRGLHHRRPKAAGIQPGAYTLKKQMKASDALTALLDLANRSVPRVTIREGMWVSEVFAALSKGTATPLTDYTAAARTGGARAARRGLGQPRGLPLPGDLRVRRACSAAEQLTTMIRTTTAAHRTGRHGRQGSRRADDGEHPRGRGALPRRPGRRSPGCCSTGSRTATTSASTRPSRMPPSGAR